MLSLKEKKEIVDEIKKDMAKPLKVYVSFCNDNAVLPCYAHIDDAGMDIRATDDITILPRETKVISTGIKVVIPSGYEIQIRPRSGLSLNTPLRIANSPGTIDSGYRDEIGIIVTNTSNVDSNNLYTLKEKGNKDGKYIIKKGDRIAQIVLCKIEKIEFEYVDKNKIDIFGINRGGGFGHSGLE